MKVPVTKPWTGKEEIELVSEVIQSGWLTQGSKVTEFENAVARYVAARHAVANSNCTTSLHLALLLNGIRPGDEVIVPSYTWIATPNSVRMVEATPVFADIDLSTFNVTAATIEAVISPRTRAIILVHQFGLPADVDSIVQVARKNKLLLIEDAACAMGSRYKEKLVGGLGNDTCFSFHPRKVISTGEGGMLVTESNEIAARARILLNHGASVSDLHKHRAGSVQALLSEEFEEFGYNYRMTNLQGALGVAQMQRLGEIIKRRRLRAERYSNAFSDISSIIPAQIPDYATTNWQSYAIRISDACKVERNMIAQRLLDAGIACRPAYMACHVQPAYRRMYPDLVLPNTETALGSVIILPLYPQMTDEEQDHVIRELELAIE
jgi:perosamine synthetase